MPLRSEPDEAAVGEVFGTLPVDVADDADAVDIDLKHLGDHLRDLDEQALPHLGAAVVQRHAAVGIDMHQRAGLIERGAVERDAELHRHGGEAFFHHRAVAR